MLNTYRLYERLSAAFSPEGAKALMETLTEYFGELENTVTKAELRELQEVVQRLAEAQERGEERLGRLEAAVEKLVAAQERNEERPAGWKRSKARRGAARTRAARPAEAAVEAHCNAGAKERLGRLEVAVEKLEVAVENSSSAGAERGRLGRLEAIESSR